MGEQRRRRDREVRELLDLADMRDSWQHRNAIAALLDIEITSGISDTALRRVVRKAGIAAIEREIEDARYGLRPTRARP